MQEASAGRTRIRVTMSSGSMSITVVNALGRRSRSRVPASTCLSRSNNSSSNRCGPIAAFEKSRLSEDLADRFRFPGGETASTVQPLPSSQPDRVAQATETVADVWNRSEDKPDDQVLIATTEDLDRGAVHDHRHRQAARWSPEAGRRQPGSLGNPSASTV